MDSPTIGALATAPAPAGIAVVRISGPKTKTVLKALFRSRKDPVADPRRLIFGELLDYKTDSVIDHALAVYMPGPHSFTGEDVCEFQFHGSPILVQKILRSLFSFGVSPAEPGEFTKRAFLNGKLDLVQAEAIADLISANNEQALKLAGEHIRGKLSAAVKEVGEPLRDLLAEIEAGIDFPEEDIRPETSESIARQLGDIAGRIKQLYHTYSYGHVIREGYRVLLFGRPNVGKSSLLNLLLGTERAIVTEVSGTTRDLIEEDAILSGYRFIFCDSAGITDSQDKVEKIGIKLAEDRIAWADLVLFVVDSTDSSGEWTQVLEQLKGKARKIWMITNKIDLNQNAIGAFFCDSSTCAQNFYLSAKTRDGFDSLLNALVEEVSSTLTQPNECNNIVTNERQKNCLLRANAAVQAAVEAISGKLPIEIAAAELRLALTALEEIVGKTYNEDILGRIFSKFCIGK